MKSANLHPHNLQLYEIETGARYWIAARNVRQALEVAWRCWEDEMSLEDVDELAIYELSEDRARRIRFVPVDGPAHSMWEEFLAQKEPAVLSCSEWP